MNSNLHPPCPPRRKFLGQLTAVGAGALLPALESAAQVPGADLTKVGRIDIHHHLLPPSYMTTSARVRAGPSPKWSPAMSIEEMDKNGIATAMVSLVQPGPWLGDAAEARRLARESNDYAARMASDYPGRFGILAALPLPDSEGSLREIEYSYGTLKADGIAVMTSYGDKWLGDPTFAPVWEELNRRKAVVYTHPLVPECCRNLVPDVTASTIEFATDTTRTIASLLFSGTAARYPDIRFVHSHGGGTTPFLLSRFVRLEAEMKNREQRLPQGVLQELQKFYYDTAQANHPGALSALLRMATTTQVLFGTDYPFRPADEATRGLREFPLRPRYHRAINRENALKLFPRLAAVSGKQS